MDIQQYRQMLANNLANVNWENSSQTETQSARAAYWLSWLLYQEGLYMPDEWRNLDPENAHSDSKYVCVLNGQYILVTTGFIDKIPQKPLNEFIKQWMY